ncbi:TPA: hypothetical protein RRH80_003002 [Klebsiella pneumoniae]|nr:hypothetical protein [Klebsiella pneumoniae]
MALYKTGNQVPSSAMPDVWDNNRVQDEILNSEKLEVETRTGIMTPTWKGVLKKNEDEIEETRQNLIPLSRQYMTLADAQADIANIPVGSTTYVRSQDGSSLADEYINNGGTLQPTGRKMPSDLRIQEAVSAINGLGTSSAGEYLGVYPIVLDADGHVILGYDQESDSLIGALDSSEQKAKRGEIMFRGSDLLHPILLDAEGRVLLGYDAQKDILFGAFFNDEEAAAAGKMLQKPEGSSGVYALLLDADNRVILGYDQESDSLIGAGIASSASSPSPSIPFPFSMVKKSVNQCFFYGQSLSVGTQGSPAITTTQPFSNLMFTGGILGTSYTSLVPCVESGRETGCATFCNYLDLAACQENGDDPNSFVSLVSAPGAGGYRITQLNKGTNRYDNYFHPQLAAGYHLNNDLQVDTLCWIQGEADSGDGVYHVETVDSYKALFLGLVKDVNDDAKAITGQSTPVVFLTYQHSTYTEEGNTQQALLEAEKEDNRVYVIVPTYIFPHFTDNLHLTNVGYRWLGAFFGRARKQIMIDGIEPKRIRPISAIYQGNKVFIRFSVPYPPLVFNSSDFNLTENFGFSVRYAGELQSVSSVTISGGDTVVLEMSQPIGSSDIEVRYAYDYNASGLKKGGTGNLVDSCRDTITILGVSKPLPYVCPHLKIKPVNGDI